MCSVIKENEEKIVLNFI